MIEIKLNNWEEIHYPNGATIDPIDAYNYLNLITSQVRAAIAAHPTTHIDNITIP